MNTCKTCLHVIPSKMILSQGTCNKIVPVGPTQSYHEAKISFASDQVAGLLSEEHNSWLIMDIEKFGCNLYEETKSSKSDTGEKVSPKSHVESKKS